MCLTSKIPWPILAFTHLASVILGGIWEPWQATVSSSTVAGQKQIPEANDHFKCIERIIELKGERVAILPFVNKPYERNITYWEMPADLQTD